MYEALLLVVYATIFDTETEINIFVYVK
jgi:hypothetical protein